MAANTSIQIVISAQDRFSGAFGRLGERLQDAERSGRGLAAALGQARGRLGAYTRSAGVAGAATAEFGRRTEESLRNLAAFRRAFREEQAALTEEQALVHGERLLAIDQQIEQMRTEAAMLAQKRRQAQARSHQAALAAITREGGQRLVAIDQATIAARLEMYRTFLVTLSALAETQGRSMARVAKGLAVATALVDTYRAANAALAQVPYPFNFAAAALVTAAGLANVERIRKVNTAHGGLEQVPEDGTFLLRRGERVLSPNQNRELTRFLERSREGGEGGVTVQHLEVHILENAAAGAALIEMDRESWREVVAERVIPALDELAELGIRPQFADEGT